MGERTDGDTRIPKHVSPTMRRWMNRVMDEWEIDRAGFKVLLVAAESWDRLQAARKVLTEKGISYVDRFGAPKARPEVAVERDARIAFLRALRELNLEAPKPEPEALELKRPYNNFRKLPEWVVRQRQQKGESS